MKECRTTHRRRESHVGNERIHGLTHATQFAHTVTAALVLALLLLVVVVVVVSSPNATAYTHD